MIKRKGSNILTSFLDALDVKYTKTFSNKYYNEHPHKYNLYGISKMLSDYEIDNAGTRINNKLEDIINIETPFIAHAGGDFVVVHDVNEKEVEYRFRNLNITMPLNEFCDSWTGIVLLAESKVNSIEPNYKQNSRKDLYQLSLRSSLIIAILVLLVTTFVNNHSYINIGLILSLAINIIGVYIGLLLIQKQLRIHSSYSDKICSLLKQADCNDILESNAAKLWGIFGWSEIGFSYFLSNIIIIVFLPDLINYYAIINICTLPYTIWSIWYQKFKAKQWCVLCLIVQFILWCIFIINLAFQFIQTSVLALIDIILLVSIYLIPFIIITLLISYLSEKSRIEDITQEINSLKSNEKIFELLLKEQPYYRCEKSDSNIIFGNPHANILVTILTNPHCNPCARMHTRIEKLLQTGIQNLCIQYIFSSFEPSLDISNKFLIAAYLNSKDSEIFSIYNNWFTKGKLNKEKFFDKFSFDLLSKEVEEQFDKHQKWMFNTKIEATPTILINGYKLPDNFQIEDLRFLSKLSLNN